MLQEEQVEKIQQLLALHANNQKDMVSSAGTLSPRVYCDEARLGLELEKLFRAAPIILGHSSQLSQAGDFMTMTLAQRPLLLTRTEQGVRGFLNVCRHRGTQVAPEECGHRQRFVCPYHAWTYDNEGRLLRIPDEEGFSGVEKSSRGLASFPVEERHGLLWGRLSGGEPLSLERYLSTLDADFSHLSLSSQVMYQPTRFSVEMNWKLAIDIFLEAYHVRYVHHKSIYPIFFDNLALFESFSPHQRNFFPKRTILSLAAEDKASWRLRAHCNILYHIFPNTLLLVQPDHLSMFHVQPDGVARSKVFAYTLLPEAPASEKAAAYWQKNIDILYGALKEDFAMGESIQRGAASGANEELLLGRYEQSLQRFHHAVSSYLGSGIGGAP